VSALVCQRICGITKLVQECARDLLASRAATSAIFRMAARDV
jgi:hypothetical protein